MLRPIEPFRRSVAAQTRHKRRRSAATSAAGASNQPGGTVALVLAVRPPERRISPFSCGPSTGARFGDTYATSAGSPRLPGPLSGSKPRHGRGGAPSNPVHSGESLAGRANALGSVRGASGAPPAACEASSALWPPRSVAT